MRPYLYIVGQMRNGLLHAPAGNGVNCIIKCYALQTNLPPHSTIFSILNHENLWKEDREILWLTV